MDYMENTAKHRTVVYSWTTGQFRIMAEKVIDRIMKCIYHTIAFIRCLKLITKQKVKPTNKNNVNESDMNESTV
jgi:hypothetical protein